MGTELEIKGAYNEQTGELNARSQTHLDQYSTIKRTALLETTPTLKRTGSAWEGSLRADGQRLIVHQDSLVTIKPNASQKKAANAAKRGTPSCRLTLPSLPRTEKEASRCSERMK